MRPRVWTDVAPLAITALLGSASVAAADTYVDAETGSGSACTLLAPCLTTQAGIDAAAAGETVRVDQGSYTTTTIGDGKSLVATDFVGSDTGPTLVDGGGWAVEVLPSGAGTISGFVLRSSGILPTVLTRSTGGASIIDNTFDAENGGEDAILLHSGASTVSGNEFSDDPADEDFDIAVRAIDGGSHTISDNSFDGYVYGVFLAESSIALISGNEFTGVRPDISFTGSGIRVRGDSNATIVANHFRDPAQLQQFGISVGEDTATPADGTGIVTRRNRIEGHAFGIVAGAAADGLELNGDLLVDNEVGIEVTSNAGVPANVNATNLTVWGSSVRDARVGGSELELESSILEDGIELFAGGTCAISNSRGPTTGPSACESFQTTAAPEFVDAPGGDYALTAANPALIDLGDPAAPAAPNLLDLDGDKRAIDGNADCTERRDMGADEFVPPPPVAAITGGPVEGQTIATASPQFSLSSTYPCAGSLQCSVDGAAFATCSSPLTIGPLPEGAHNLSVRSVDLVPQTGSTVSRGFTVDLPAAADPPAAGSPTTPAPATTKRCKKGQKLKKGRCVKRKPKKKKKA